jgi:uncharacterized protein YjbI with pentapeptide repeats
VTDWCAGITSRSRRACQPRAAPYEFDGEHCALLGCDLAEANFDAARLRETDLHGSTIDDARGGLSLRGARISLDQIVSLAGTLLDVLGIQVTKHPPR